MSNLASNPQQILNIKQDRNEKYEILMQPTSTANQKKSETYLEPSQTYTMDLLAAIFKQKLHHRHSTEF